MYGIFSLKNPHRNRPKNVIIAASRNDNQGLSALVVGFCACFMWWFLPFDRS